LCNPYDWEITRRPGNLGSDYCPSGSDSGQIELEQKRKLELVEEAQVVLEIQRDNSYAVFMPR